MNSQVKELLAVAVLIEACFLAVAGAPNTNVTNVGCNSGIYTGGDPFAKSLDYVLTDLLEATPVRKGHNYNNISPYPNAFAYGHAACNASLISTDCSACLDVGLGLINRSCAMSIGARAVLYDCIVRYEQYPFSSN